MKILFFNQHPVDPLIVSNAARILQSRGHDVLFLVMERENIISNLIQDQGFKFVIIGKTQSNQLLKLTNGKSILKNYYKWAKEFKPDIVFSSASIYTGLIGVYRNVPSIGWDDTEIGHFNSFIHYPLISTLLFPTCFLGRTPPNNTIFFNSYKELGYLHPKWYKQDNSILDELRLSKNDRIILLRFSSMDAIHDIGVQNITKTKNKIDSIHRLVKALEKDARIFISNTELDLGKRFSKYYLKISPCKYKHFLAYCSLYVGEGSTTASEAGFLGIPWIYLRYEQLGTLEEQKNRFNLGFQITNYDIVLEKANELLADSRTKQIWSERRKNVFQQKIDLTSFLVWFFEEYPSSIEKVRNNQEFQNKFIYRID